MAEINFALVGVTNKGAKHQQRLENIIFVLKCSYQLMTFR